MVFWRSVSPSHPSFKIPIQDPRQNVTVEHLKSACAKRSAAIKFVIMDAKVVVGVGNIYVSEALFRAGIRPATPANKISKPTFSPPTVRPPALSTAFTPKAIS